MTAPRVALNGGWTPFQGGGQASADLIGILDTVDTPVVVARRDLTIACFNKTAADRLGLSPADVGRAARDIRVLADVPQLRQRCAQVMTSGVDARVDVRDGSRRFVVRISPYITGDRQVSGTVLTFTNVTAFRASIEQAIYERECTKAILNTVAEPLIVLSADQRIQSGNRAFYTMFEASRDETQGIPLTALGYGAFALAPLRQQLDALLAGSEVFEPVELNDVRTAHGCRTFILDARPLAFPGHSERRVLVTFQDITAQKQAAAAKDLRSEAELRRSEAFLAEGQRLSLTGSFHWKVSTDDLTWSEQLYRIFEFEPGTPVTIGRLSSRIHPEDLPLITESIERARAAGDDFEFPHRLLMPDGSVKHLNAIAHRSRDAAGRLEYVGAVQDVTQRRRSEEALAEARSALATVSRVTTLGVLTASIAHEVNQPLSGIITNASTCMRMLATDPPNVDGALETARRTIRDGNRAAEVITRLRALFDNKGPRAEAVDLNEATREVIALSLNDLQRNRVTLRTDLADDLPTVTGDRVQLQQVILNLLRNASDAMTGVDDRARDLVVRTERDEGDLVRVSVQDVGVGIEPDGLDKVFETLYTTKQDGMGIGLSVSRYIIESHQGRLWAAPNDGPGATFSFAIPITATGAPAERAVEHARRTS